MEQDRVVNKVLRDIRASFKMTDSDAGILRQHLNYVYGAGWDDGHHKTIHYANKEVYQCNKEGHIINSFPSATDAANKLHIDRTTIYLAIAEKRMTRKGYYWKHKEEIT